MRSFPDRHHNHDHCIDSALANATRYCEQQGLRFTNTRRDVLQIIWQNHQPIGAYAILDQLRDQQPGRKLAPPTIYRALDFLVEQGLVHRINSLNAYIGCPLSEDHQPSLFLICRKCGNVAEVDHSALPSELEALCANTGFRLEQAMLEITGLCPDCHIRVRP